MLEKFQAVKNPLTVIAVFAGLAEVSGTTVLPLIDKDVQHIYVWFLMFFPVILVTLFFLTLNFNHKTLYAPSDFRDDEGFFRALTPAEQRQKVEREAAEQAIEQLAVGEGVAPEAAQQDQRQFVQTYFQAEDLVLRELQAEFGPSVRRNVALTIANRTIEVDAAITLKRSLIAVEVKVFSVPHVKSELFNSLRDMARDVDRAAQQSGEYWGGSVMLVVVTTFALSAHKDFERRLREASRDMDLRIYELEDLQRKYGAVGL
jgi:hypothetical protein